MQSFAVFADCLLQSLHTSTAEENDTIGSNEDDDNNLSESVVVKESEFQDGNGRLWQQVTHKNTMDVVAKCNYPKHNNAMHGCLKSFNFALAKQWIRQRLTG